MAGAWNLSSTALKCRSWRPRCDPTWIGTQPTSFGGTRSIPLDHLVRLTKAWVKFIGWIGSFRNSCFSTGRCGYTAKIVEVVPQLLQQCGLWWVAKVLWENCQVTSKECKVLVQRNSTKIRTEEIKNGHHTLI